MKNPHWLRSFATLVETGGFTRAAERLGVTQAVVSQHVRHLEDAFGPLLIRHPRQIELTPAGMALLEYCDEIEVADRRLKLRLADASARSGEISLITPGSVGLALYPRLLTLQQSHPGLVIRDRFAPDSETHQAVLGRQYELGLVTRKPDDPRLTATSFIEEPLELVVPVDAAVAGWQDLERLASSITLKARQWPPAC
ncbi:LysR family transcriptional regulator [Xanthomonas cassavae]|uniref:LysR family transcriptional regulator n=1 Tax=Xanthomonas cassavae TaxID=56450 RepID=UPI00040C3971|nr:LysR family transcriptional regulator [Xanthomonas cassavae]